MKGPVLLRLLLPGAVLGWIATDCSGIQATPAAILLFPIGAGIVLSRSDVRHGVMGTLLLGIALGSIGFAVGQMPEEDGAIVEGHSTVGIFKSVKMWRSMGNRQRTVVEDMHGDKSLVVHDGPWPAGWCCLAELVPATPASPVHPADFDEAGFLHARGIGAKYTMAWRSPLSPVSGIHAAVLRHLILLQSRVEEKCRRWGKGAGVGLLIALTTGDRSGMSTSVRRAFEDAGLAHLTAVSGFHTGLVAALVYMLISMAGASRLGGLALLLAAIWMYVGLCGMPGSAVRAAIMATMAAVARALHIRADGLTLLSFAGLFMFARSPQAVQDLGLQLSFSATAGILLLHRRMRGWPHWKNRGRWMLWCAVPIVAVMVTAPMAWPVFGRQPLIFLPANLLATPLVSLCALMTVIGMAIPMPLDLQWGHLCVAVADVLVEVASTLGRFQPVLLPLDSAVVTWAGLCMAAGCVAGLLLHGPLRYMLAGAMFAWALLRWQAFEERKGMAFDIEGDVVLYKDGRWSVFPAFPLKDGRGHTWKTRTFLERVSRSPVPEARWCGSGMSFSTTHIRYRTPDGLWGGVSSSRSRCGSRGPHTLPRPPCP